MMKNPTDPNRIAPSIVLKVRVGVIAALVGVLAGCDSSSKQVPTPPAVIRSMVGVSNVLLITIDTLRADHMSAYGYGIQTTPNLDRRFGDGMRFDRAFSSASFTIPAHVAIFTGVYSEFTSAKLENGAQFGLEPGAVTLAELCQSAGMRTLAVVSSDTLLGKVGLKQGFDQYDDILRERNPQRLIGKQPAEYACGKALHMLADDSSKPFFMWLHLMDPHGPYVPRPEFLAKIPRPAAPDVDLPQAKSGQQFGYNCIPRYQRYGHPPKTPIETNTRDYIQRYDAEIASMDHELGLLFDTLEQRGVLKNTLVIIVADHGEALGEDGYWFAHSQTVGRELVHVPMGIFGPGVKPGVIEQQVGTIDIMSTVCDAIGLPLPENSHGHSLVSALKGGAVPTNMPHMTASSTGNLRGIAEGDRYYESGGSVHPAPPFGPRLSSIGDWSPQPLNRLAGMDEELGRFKATAEVAMKRTPDPAAKVNRTQAEKKRLGTLGYLEDSEEDEPQNQPRD